jgi:hypothetical protein
MLINDIMKFGYVPGLDVFMVQAFSGDMKESELAVDFRACLADATGTPNIQIGQTIAIGFACESSPWSPCGDGVTPIFGYVLESFPSPTPTNSDTPVNTATNTPASTFTETPTPTPTLTKTPVDTATNTPTATFTETPTPTLTPTPVDTATNTPTSTSTETAEPTPTPTETPPDTTTNTPTAIGTAPPAPTLTPEAPSGIGSWLFCQ